MGIQVYISCHIQIILISTPITKSCEYSNSFAWSHGSWIYIYLYNQCLSPLKLWVLTPFMARCTRYNIMWSSLSVTCDRSVVFTGYPGLLRRWTWVPMDVCHHISSIYKAENILNMNFRIREICIYTVSCITSFRCTAYILSLSFSDNEMLRR